MSLKKNETILRNLTLSAFQERTKAQIYINLMLSNLIEEQKTEEKSFTKTTVSEENFIIEYLHFLKEIAGSEKPALVLKKTDQKILDFMKSLLISQISNELTKKLNLLTKLALNADPKTTLLIAQARLVFDNKKENQFYIQYLDFLDQLYQSKDKKKYLRMADQKTVQFMNKLLITQCLEK